jgi:cytochrome c peroxidase
MWSTRHLPIAVLMLLVLATLAQAQLAAGASAAAAGWAPKTPLGLDDVSGFAPKDNPLTEHKVLLGKKLFWDKRLSSTSAHSCQSCHTPEKGWADTLAVSMKANGRLNTRHTQSLYNTAFQKSWFWDGRASSLEAAVRLEWEEQLGASGKTEAIARKLNDLPGYRKLFEEAFGPGPVNPDKIVKAIASFTRTIMSANTHYDCYTEGAKASMSAAAKRGWELFRSTARCGVCHLPGYFTDGKYHMMGVGHGGLVKGDPGRMAIVDNPKLEGAVKTPTLRNVLAHPPFMHDGTFKTIEDVFKYYEMPYGAKNLAPEIEGGIHLNDAQKKDLIEFLKAIESADDPETSAKPDLP